MSHHFSPLIRSVFSHIRLTVEAVDTNKHCIVLTPPDATSSDVMDLVRNLRDELCINPNDHICIQDQWMFARGMGECFVRSNDTLREDYLDYFLSVAEEEECHSGHLNPELVIFVVIV